MCVRGWGSRGKWYGGRKTREGFSVVKQIKLKRFSDRFYGRHEEEERSGEIVEQFILKRSSRFRVEKSEFDHS